MPNTEFIGWRAFDTIYPLGHVAEDQRSNALLRTLWSAHSQPRTRIPDDFYQRLERHKEKEEQPLDDKIKQYFKVYMEVGAKKRRRKRKRAELSEAEQAINTENNNNNEVSD